MYKLNISLIDIPTENKNPKKFMSETTHTPNVSLTDDI
jgi:hypothetical protein